MSISEIITITFAVFGAACAALKIIAPLTENKWDNKILKILEEILKIVSWDKNNKVLGLFKDTDDSIKIKIKQ